MCEVTWLSSLTRYLLPRYRYEVDPMMRSLTFGCAKSLELAEL